jgi:GT2 family glycosyltransferase
LGLARSQHRPAGNGLVTQPVNYPGSSTAVAKALGVDKALSEGVEPLGWLFLAAGDTLAPNALAIHEAVLRRCPEVGVVGTWLADPEKPWSGELASTPPAFPYQWLANELEEPVVFRAEAVREVGGPRTDLDSGLETWDLANAVMAAGWAAVRIPAILGHREGGLDGVEDAMPLARKRSRRRLLDRHPELVGRDATSLIALLEAKVTDGYGRSSGQHSAEPVAAPATLGRSLRPMLHLAKMATRQPGAAGRRLVWQSKAIARARLARLRNTPPDGAA